MSEDTRTADLRVTCDTTVVIDALDGTRQAAIDLFARARAGAIDVAFSTRLEYELQRHTLDEVRMLVARDIEPPGNSGPIQRKSIRRRRYLRSRAVTATDAAADLLAPRLR